MLNLGSKVKVSNGFVNTTGTIILIDAKDRNNIVYHVQTGLKEVVEVDASKLKEIKKEKPIIAIDSSPKIEKASKVNKLTNL